MEYNESWYIVKPEIAPSPIKRNTENLRYIIIPETIPGKYPIMK